MFLVIHKHWKEPFYSLVTALFQNSRLETTVSLCSDYGFGYTNMSKYKQETPLRNNFPAFSFISEAVKTY